MIVRSRCLLLQRPLFHLALGATLVASAFAQTTGTVPAPPVGTEGAQKTGQNDAARAADSTGTHAGDTHLSKQQAAELLGSIDGILAFVSKDTKLTSTHPIKRVIRTREEVTRILHDKMAEDEGAKRMQRAELVLKKFGLLDRDFDLQPFLLSLLTEQVAGFYDPKSRTVNLLDWVKPEDQKPVMAHELTHALQDDRVGLEKWSSPQPNDMSHDERGDNLQIQTDEASTARQAVTEGQAMVTFVDYGLKDSGKTLKDVPEIGDRLQQMSGDTSSSPILSRAPLVLQQSLLFPYTGGLAFEQALLIHGSTAIAFAGALDHPPTSSHEILHPDEYLAHTPVPILAMPNVHPLLDKAWTPYDIGVMGELDVRMMAELFGGQQIAGPLAEAWDGGIYFAAQKKSATPAEKKTTGSLGLLYLSRWKNEDSARTFMRVYAAQLPRKYDHLQAVKDLDGSPDRQTYTTPEGDVVLSLVDKTVFVSEGFDRMLARQLEAKMRDVQGVGPIQTAQVPVPRQELTPSFAALLGAFGTRESPNTQRSIAPGLPGIGQTAVEHLTR